MIVFIICAVVLRLIALWIFRRHERTLVASGAREVGAGNTVVLALAHTAFYLAGAVEYALGPGRTDGVAVLGLCLWACAMLMLAVVMRLLGPLWTVKLMIAPAHPLVTHPLFRVVRHPNYFLNILPELLGYGLALHAFATLIFGLPAYLVPLAVRIRQEEVAMRASVPGYR